MKASTGPFVVTAKTSTYRGTKLWSTSTRPRPGAPADPAATRAFGADVASTFAVVDRTVVMAMAPDAPVRTKALIDALRAAVKKPRPPATTAVTAALAEARRRRESAIITMDLATLMAWEETPAAPAGPPPSSPPVVLALGADGGALALRLTVPAAQVQQAVAAKAVAATAAIDTTLATMDHVADDLCRCPDVTCAQGVMTAMTNLRDPGGAPTKAQLDQAMAIAARMSDCQKRLMAAPTPAPAP